jgi:PAS domain S-box-containing protein
MDRFKNFRDLEHSRRDERGGLRRFRASGKALFDEAGKFAGYRGTTVDITDQVEAEKQAEETKERLFNAMEAMAEGVVFWDADDRIIAFNHHYFEIHSFIADVIVPGTSFIETLEARTKLPDSDIDDLSKKEWFEKIMEARRKDKFVIQDVWIDGKMYLVRRLNNDDGTAITFMTDVTGIRQTEAELKQIRDELEVRVEARTKELEDRMEDLDRAHGDLVKGEERFKMIAETASDWFWETDANHCYTYISPHFFELVPQEETYLGDRVGDLSPKILRGESNPEVDELLAKLDTHEKLVNFERSLIGANGDEVFYLSSAKPIFDEAGIFVGYRGASSNITGRKRMEDELRQREQQLREIFDKSPIGVGISEASNGNIVFANPGLVEIFNFKSFEDVVGTNSADYWFNEEDRNALMTTYWDTGHIPLTEARMQSHNREMFWVLVSWESFNVPDKEQIIFWLYDIDELKQAQADLEKAKERSDLHWAEAETANRTKSEFLANMSYELRTPLNAIIGFADALNHNIFGDIPDSRQSDAVGHIKESGEHLLSLISDILDVSAIETGAMELSEEILEMPIIITAAIRMVEQRARSNDVEIITNIKMKKLKFSADSRRIKQILVNLLTNAVKFTPSGGIITLEATMQYDRRFLISVSDTGVGMAAEEIDKAMIRFGQVGREDRSDQEGTGLGLPLTRDLIELHGGEMEISSTPGVGTTVRALFPSDRVLF